jgi:hypothetical protein
MNKTFLFALWLILTLSSCQDPGTNAETKKQNSIMNRTVGEQIPTDLANRWIDFYERKSSSGRMQESQCTVTALPFDQILSSIPMLGLAFHYAIDESGAPHILILPISEEKKLWSSDASRICIDANTNSIITESVARDWTQTFKDANPNAIWYHFFGSNILDEMRSVSGFNEFEIIPALNDEGMKQLLLVINNDSDLNGGRILSESLVYDKGGLCPPCDVDENPTP